MRVDHVAVAVKSIEASAPRICRLTGYNVATQKVHNSRQRVNVVFLEQDGSLDIKLIEPCDPESPLWDFLRRKGEGLHHLCFKVEDVEKGCEQLSALGARVLVAPEPGEAFAEHSIAFLYFGSGLNVELIDSDERG